MSDDVVGNVDLIDLRSDVADPAERRALCTAFFESVYRAAFPKADQSESPDVWLPLLDRDHPPPAPILHLVVARHRDRGASAVIGGIIIEYFRRSETALATYLAVAPEGRRQGLGRRLLDDAIATVTADNRGRRPIILAEVERPEAQRTQEDRQAALARLAIISALGGRRLDVAYIQPSLGEGKQPQTDLMLVAFPDDASLGSMPAQPIRDFIDEFFASLGQAGSAEHERVARSIAAERVSLGGLRSDERTV